MPFPVRQRDFDLGLLFQHDGAASLLLVLTLLLFSYTSRIVLQDQASLHNTQDIQYAASLRQAP